MRTPIPFAAPLASISLALAACATAPHGPGMLDARMADAAQSPTAREAELTLEPGGAVSKIAVNDTSTAGVPDGLRKLVEQNFPGAVINETELELYADAGLVHEAEVKTADGRECEVSMNAEGALRYTECEIKPAELPAKVAQALAAAAPAPEIAEAELRTAQGVTEYRIKCKSGTRRWYFRISPEGAMNARAIILPAELRVPVK